jgi:hypothetical protein
VGEPLRVLSGELLRVSLGSSWGFQWGALESFRRERCDCSAGIVFEGFIRDLLESFSREIFDGFSKDWSQGFRWESLEGFNREHFDGYL